MSEKRDVKEVKCDNYRAKQSVTFIDVKSRCVESNGKFPIKYTFSHRIEDGGVREQTAVGGWKEGLRGALEGRKNHQISSTKLLLPAQFRQIKGQQIRHITNDPLP
jgi:hypothetical protein